MNVIFSTAPLLFSPRAYFKEIAARCESPLSGPSQPLLQISCEKKCKNYTALRMQLSFNYGKPDNAFLSSVCKTSRTKLGMNRRIGI